MSYAVAVTDPTATLRLHRFTLRFADRALEREFQRELGRQAHTQTRVGFAAAAVLWVLCGFLLPTITAPSPALYGVVAFMTAANVIAFAAGGWADTLDRQQLLGTVMNTLAGFAVLVITELAGAFDRYAAPALMMMTIFAFLVLRLRFVSATVAALTYVTAFTSIAISRSHGLDHAMDIFLVASALGISAAAAYFLETASRTVFHQTRVIESQQFALEREKEKSDRLLLNVLPEPIAARLREDTASVAEAFDDASVLFADLVGFTPLSERMPAERVVAMLNELFSRFDDLAEQHGVEKIKTIGDAYMAVAGVPTPCADHAERVVAMGLEMLAVVAERAARDELELELRVGVHSGPVVAGVIGKKRFIYDLWGDTVNVASRMESHGLPGKLQLSDATLARLGDGRAVEERAPIDVKGKGRMRTFLLAPASNEGSASNERETVTRGSAGGSAE